MSKRSRWSQTAAAAATLLDIVCVDVDMIYEDFNSQLSFVQKHSLENSL